MIAALPAGLRQSLFAVAPPDLRRKLELSLGPQQIVARDLAEGKLLRAIYSERQLDEILVDFWFNHFNVYLDKGADRYLVTAVRARGDPAARSGEVQGPAVGHGQESGDAVLPG